MRQGKVGILYSLQKEEICGMKHYGWYLNTASWRAHHRVLGFSIQTDLYRESFTC